MQVKPTYVPSCEPCQIQAACQECCEPTLATQVCRVILPVVFPRLFHQLVDAALLDRNRQALLVALEEIRALIVVGANASQVLWCAM